MLPQWLSGKEFTCNPRDADSIHGMGICPGEGNGNPHQYSCLENPMVREAWHTHVLSHSSSHLSSLASCSSNPFPPPHSYWTTSLSSACTPKGCCFTLHTPLMTPVLIIVIFPWKNSSSKKFSTRFWTTYWRIWSVPWFGGFKFRSLHSYCCFLMILLLFYHFNNF